MCLMNVHTSKKILLVKKKKMLQILVYTQPKFCARCTRRVTTTLALVDDDNYNYLMQLLILFSFYFSVCISLPPKDIKTINTIKTKGRGCGEPHAPQRVGEGSAPRIESFFPLSLVELVIF